MIIQDGDKHSRTTYVTHFPTTTVTLYLDSSAQLQMEYIARIVEPFPRSVCTSEMEGCPLLGFGMW